MVALYSANVIDLDQPPYGMDYSTKMNMESLIGRVEC